LNDLPILKKEANLVFFPKFGNLTTSRKNVNEFASILHNFAPNVTVFASTIILIIDFAAKLHASL